MNQIILAFTSCPNAKLKFLGVKLAFDMISYIFFNF